MLIKQNNFVNLYKEGQAVVVLPPSRRMIEVVLNGEDRSYFDDYKTKNYFLSMPYTVFAVNYIKTKKGKFKSKNLYCLFAKDADCKKLYRTPLFNIDDESRVCIPLPRKTFATLEDLCKACVASFWSSKFTEDNDSCREYYNGTGAFVKFERWQSATKKNPLWVPNKGLVECDKLDVEEFMLPTYLKRQM